MNAIANYNEINTLLVEVSTKINEKNIKEFVDTSLELNRIEYSQRDILLVNYLEESNNYQIYVFNNKNKYMISDIFQTYYLDKIIRNEYDLFLNKNFIVIYKNSQFYYFQKFNYKIVSNDLVEYFQKKLNIKINNIYKLDCNKIEELKTEFIEKIDTTTLKNLNTKISRSFYIYCMYILLLISISTYYYNSSKVQTKQKIEDEQSSIENKLLFAKEKLKFTPFHLNLNNLIETIKKYKLRLIHINYQKNSLNLEFISLNKKDIYLFLNEYRDVLVSNSIVYIEDKKYYKCSSNVRVIKK